MARNYEKLHWRVKTFRSKTKYGIFECLNGHKIFTSRGIALKICILAKTNTIFPFLDL